MIRLNLVKELMLCIVRLVCVAKELSLEKHDNLPCQDVFRVSCRLKERLTSLEFHNNSNISLAHVFPVEMRSEVTVSCSLFYH